MLGARTDDQDRYLRGTPAAYSAEVGFKAWLARIRKSLKGKV